MGKKKSIRKTNGLVPMSQREIHESAEVYADCFSSDRSSLKWLDAYEEHSLNCQKFNRFLFERTK